MTNEHFSQENECPSCGCHWMQHCNCSESEVIEGRKAMEELKEKFKGIQPIPFSSLLEKVKRKSDGN